MQLHSETVQARTAGYPYQGSLVLRDEFSVGEVQLPSSPDNSAKQDPGWSKPPARRLPAWPGSEGWLGLLVELSTDVIMLVGPEGHRLYVSPGVRQMLGYEPEELIGLAAGGTVHPEDRLAWLGCSRQLISHEVTEATYRCIRKNGSIVWVEAKRRYLADHRSYVVVVRDISERKRIYDDLTEANRQLHALAIRDGLTGLSNRRHFDEMLLAEMRRAAREVKPLALMLIDVDHFKKFNDRYGHVAGDECLVAVGRAIQGVLRRPADLAARYGGEEFAVLLPNTDEAGAANVAQRLLQSVLDLKIPHPCSHQGVVAISGGVVTLWPECGLADPKQLIGRADANLYRAKQEGRNRIQA